MTYQKPADVTYVEMCMYFDAHIYDADRDDNLLYQYLYHIVYMLACKARFFPQNFDEYDDFALYASSRLYMRYPQVVDGKIEVDEDKKIKSILNYTNATLYPLKVDYQKETYAQIFSYDDDIKGDTLISNTKLSIQREYAEGIEQAITDSLRLIPKIAKKKIQETPYRNDKLFCKRLYISCLLSLINSMTLSKTKLQKIAKKSDINEREELFLKSLQRERRNAVIVWHLPETYRDLIQVLVNKVRKELDNEITQTKNQFSLSDADLENIMMSAFGGGNNYDENY